jgi:N-acetylglucosaminyldiphosphoundecaprenol N-acetyl-beta-D-mannosaminyltransferase
MNKNIRIFKKITNIVSYDFNIAEINKVYATKGSAFISFVNPYSIKVGANDAGYISDLESLDFVYSDGILLARLVSRYSQRDCLRFSFDGNSIAPSFFKYANENHLDTAFIGGISDISKKAAHVIKSEYMVNVVKSRDGYFHSNDEIIETIRRIHELDIKFVVVGMGAPYQERFLIKLKESEWKGIAVSCGGYLDQIVVGNNKKYYPDIFNRFNLRFFYRILKEPKKLIPRYFIDYLPFYSCILGVYFRR